MKKLTREQARRLIVVAADPKQPYRSRFQALCRLNDEYTDAFQFRAIIREGTTFVILEACYRMVLMLKRRYGTVQAGRDMFHFLIWQMHAGITDTAPKRQDVMALVGDEDIFPREG